MHGELYATEYGFDHRFEGYVAETLAEFGKIRRADRDRLWLAERGGRLVGSIGIIGREGNAAQLRWLLIAPDARGHGLGRRLLTAALAFCRATGYETVFFWTVRGLPAAAYLYASVGFHLTEELPPADWGAPVIEQRFEARLSGGGCGVGGTP